MTKPAKTLKKGGYLGDQSQIVRFRASAGLYEKLQETAQDKGLCLAALVRGLVRVGLEKNNS